MPAKCKLKQNKIKTKANVQKYNRAKSLNIYLCILTGNKDRCLWAHTNNEGLDQLANSHLFCTRINPCPAEPGYTLLLQTVQIQEEAN